MNFSRLLGLGPPASHRRAQRTQEKNYTLSKRDIERGKRSLLRETAGQRRIITEKTALMRACGKRGQYDHARIHATGVVRAKKVEVHLMETNERLDAIAQQMATQRTDVVVLDALKAQTAHLIAVCQGHPIAQTAETLWQLDRAETAHDMLHDQVTAAATEATEHVDGLATISDGDSEEAMITQLLLDNDIRLADTLKHAPAPPRTIRQQQRPGGVVRRSPPPMMQFERTSNGDEAASAQCAAADGDDALRALQERFDNLKCPDDHAPCG